jgi:hypothetical protein
MKPICPSRLSCIALGIAGLMALSPHPLLAANNAVTGHEHGTVKTVDAKTRSVMVTGPKDRSEKRFLWNDQTKFVEGRKPVTAAELKAGERVRISYTKSGDSPLLQSVHILPEKAKPTH